MGNTIYQKLSQLQQAYSAPKSEYNSFGGYAYRSFETMLDTLKPLLSEFGLVLTTTNKLAECGGHVYVQSICTITDIETGESISSDSYAREDDTRKGMVGAQITGGCVSYSAKYALGLLLSVGTGQKDADSMDNRPQTQNSRPQPPQTRPTPPPQSAPYQPPVQQAPPMQYTAPPMQYTAPPMAPQQTAPQYQPPQQPVTAPPVQQAPPMAQQQPIQTAQPPMQTPPQPQAPISADAPKQTPPFTRKERPAPPQQAPISADAPNFSRPPRPAEDSIPVQPQLKPSAIPASWGITEACAPDELLPLDANGEPIMDNNTAASGWMSIPEGVVEGELPFA